MQLACPASHFCFSLGRTLTLGNLQFGRSAIMWSSVCACGRTLWVQAEKLETSNDANRVVLTQARGCTYNKTDFWSPIFLKIMHAPGTPSEQLTSAWNDVSIFRVLHSHSICQHFQSWGVAYINTPQVCSWLNIRREVLLLLYHKRKASVWKFRGVSLTVPWGFLGSSQWHLKVRCDY